MSEKPFFILKAEEVKSVGFFYVKLYENITHRDDLKYIVELDRGINEGFGKLYKVINEIISPKGSECININDVNLDFEMTCAMLQSINRGLFIIKKINEQYNDNEDNEELINAINKNNQFLSEHKEETKDLLIKLTKALHYMPNGLMALEDYFNLKIAEYPVYINDEGETFVLTLNDIYSSMFNFVISLFETIIANKDKYIFAERFFNCQYIHITDYFMIREKLKGKKAGEKVTLTEADSIIIYLLLNLTGRFFSSNSVELFEKIVEYNESLIEDKIGVKELRRPILSYLKIIIDIIEEKLADSEDFNIEIKRIENWVIDM